MIVVDASVAFKWFIEEAHSREAVALAAGEELLAPTWLAVEVANALWKKVMRHQANAVGVRMALPRLNDFVAQWCEVAPDLVERALDIALDLGHPVYDCVYLALAEAGGMGLATADEKLRARCQSTRFAPLLMEWRTTAPQ